MQEVKVKNNACNEIEWKCPNCEEVNFEFGTVCELESVECEKCKQEYLIS